MWYAFCGDRLLSWWNAAPGELAWQKRGGGTGGGRARPEFERGSACQESPYQPGSPCSRIGSPVCLFRGLPHGLPLRRGGRRCPGSVGRLLREATAATFTRDALSAVAYLHERRIAHRDVKPENLLLQSAERGARLVLADFGLARRFSPGEPMLTRVGTPYYTAPEAPGRVGRRSRVWRLARLGGSGSEAESRPIGLSAPELGHHVPSSPV